MVSGAVPHCLDPCSDCAESVEINITSNNQVMHFLVSLLGTTNHGLTWLYSVKKIGTKQDLSHFDIELCFPSFPGAPEDLIQSWRILEFNPVTNQCTANVLASGTGQVNNFKIMPQGDPSIGCAGTLPLIKFDNLGDFAPVTSFCFEFTLTRSFALECAHIGLKAGRITDCQCIKGPSPVCHPLLTRGLIF